MLNKVPAVTLIFWLIKTLATTVGETAADYLNMTLKFGLLATSGLMAVLLVIALAVQLWTRRYIPAVYWLVVVLISVVGTLISDNLVDNLGVSLEVSSAIFAVASAVFGVWYLVERSCLCIPLRQRGVSCSTGRPFCSRFPSVRRRAI